MPESLIETLDDPRLEPYRDLKLRNLTEYSGRFIGEGRLVVQRLLASRFEVESVLISDRRHRLIGHEIPPETTVYIVPQALCEQLVGYNFHSGILACGFRQPSPRIDDVLNEKRQERLTLVACPQITDPINLGTIIRLCTAFGIDALVLGRSCVDPFSRRVVRVSMGNVFRLPVLQPESLEQTLADLQKPWQVELVATLLDDAAEPLEQFERPERCALLFGNEAEGLETNWIEYCQHKVTIPMAPGTDSLNVGVAAGIFLHHFTRMS